MKTLLSISILIFLWWIVSHSFDLSLILPTPEETLSSLIGYLSSFETYRAIFSTILKSVLVSILAIAFGVPLGFFMGLNRTFMELLKPVITVVQAVPIVSWLALVIFTWGIGWRGPVAIGVVSLMPSVVFNTMEGVRSVDKDLVEMARVYEVSRLKTLRMIYLGSLVPFITASLNLIAGNVWKVVLVAEFLCGDTGIGVEISWARQSVDVPAVYALTVIGVSLGLLSERIVRFSTRRLERRWGIC